MIKTLTKHGNSLALIIDRPILDLLKIQADTPLSITTDGTRLIVSPSGGDDRSQFLRTALQDINARFGDDLKKLAE